jgi:hypothetical protein
LSTSQRWRSSEFEDAHFPVQGAHDIQEVLGITGRVLDAPVLQLGQSRAPPQIDVRSGGL